MIDEAFTAERRKWFRGYIRYCLGCLGMVAGVIVFAQTNSPMPKPIPSAVPSGPDLHPLTILWDYTNNPPAITVLQFTTNANGFALVTNVPSVTGTNRVTVALPAGNWSVAAWGADGKNTSVTSRLTASRTNYVVVNDIYSKDLRTWKTNALSYAGPKRGSNEWWSHSITDVYGWRGN